MPTGKQLDECCTALAQPLSPALAHVWLPAGNVARFINHSCEPNLVVQPILAEGCSALRYLVAIVAACNIPAHTELSYDYNYALLNGRQLHCSCGAVKCRGRLH